VVDSSVAFKWFSSRGESCVEEALALLEAHAHGDVLLAAPAHLPAEVINGLRYAGLGPELLASAAATLESFGLAVIPLDARLLQDAIRLAEEHALTIHDALFPALAMRFECELVTADRAHSRVSECPIRLMR
jgi:predicted nucleic acid-binding protein